MSTPTVNHTTATVRVLLCYVPKQANDDSNAEKGARFFSGQINSIGGADHNQTRKSTVLHLGEAIAASKLSEEFLRDTGTILVIGHGQAVYSAINDNEFFSFLKRFDTNRLQSLIFISCELNKQHPELPGFEANIISLLVKSVGATPKVYASKTDVAFKVLTADHFVWMHTPETHLVPALASSVLRKNPQEKDVQDAMDTFSSS